MNDRSNKAADHELRRRAHKVTRKKVCITFRKTARRSLMKFTDFMYTDTSANQVSLKFRDPLSLTALYEYLIPSRRITTEHEDINAYVQRAGGLNEALLSASVIAERDFMRYSEAHVS